MKNENFAILRDAIIVRKKATEVLRVLSMQTQKRIEQLNEKMMTEFYSALKEQMRVERFNEWLIHKECDFAAQAAMDITANIRSANTIFPKIIEEYTERRIFWDKALAACNVLQDELQYIAEAVYADKNKFTALVLDIEKIFRTIKSVRQADNRFLKKI